MPVLTRPLSGPEVSAAVGPDGRLVVDVPFALDDLVTASYDRTRAGFDDLVEARVLAPDAGYVLHDIACRPLGASPADPPRVLIRVSAVPADTSSDEDY